MKLTFHPVDHTPTLFKITKPSFVIGRSPSCDISLVMDGISRQHCKVELIDGEIFITDLGSTNGVFIDGKRIKPKVATRYQTFFPLSIGAIPTVTIELAEPTQNLGLEWPSEVTQSNSNSTNQDRLTKRANRAPKRPPPKPKPSKPERSASKTLIINMLAIIMVAGAAWYYYAVKKQQSAQEVSEPVPLDEKSFNDNGHF